MGSQSTRQHLGVESEMRSSDNTMSDNNTSSSLWAPGSPRLSFSRDFVQSEVFKPSTSSADSADSDFDFGMFALLRADNTGSVTPMLPAHQLIHNGKILLPHQSPPPEERVQSDHSESPPKPDKVRRSWRDLFPLNFKRSSSSSASAATSSPETVPLSAACSSFPSASLREKTSSKLRFLFRSSSAGSSTREQSLEPEPSLGRSASESNVSSSPCDPFPVSDRNAAIEPLTHRGAEPGVSQSGLHRRAGSMADTHTGQIPSDTWKIPRERIRHRSFTGRPVLAEVKVGGAGSPGSASPNFQRFNNNSGLNKSISGKPMCWTGSKKVGSSSSSSNTNANTSSNTSSSSRSGKSSSSNALRAYMSNANRNPGNMKVAEVLHMEVCMGQSISKAFSMRKENEIQASKCNNTNNSNKVSFRCNPEFSLPRLPRGVSCHSQSFEQM